MSIEKAMEAFTAPIPLGEQSASKLTKRELFAGLAMSGWLASYGKDEHCDVIGAAEHAAKCADALLAELEKTK